MVSAEFTYPSVVESVETMLDDLDEILNRENVFDHARHGFMVAVSEAFSNALLHANRLDRYKTISVRISVNNSNLIADIEDEGTDGLEKILGRCPPTDQSENGRGVDIIKHYADQVEFAKTECGGLKVTIRIERKKREEVDL